MPRIIKKCTNLFSRSKALLRFELVYKLIGVGILIPTFLSMLNLSVHLAGLTYLTNDNYMQFLLNPAGLLVILCIPAVYAFYTMVELSSLTLYFYAAAQGRRMTAKQMFTAGIRTSVRLLHPRNLLMVPYLLLIVPLTTLPVLFAYIGTIQIPAFISNFIIKRHWLIILLLILIALMAILSFFFIFSIFYFSAEGKPFFTACRLSFQLQKGKRLKTAGRLLLWQLGLTGGFLFCYLLFIGAALLLSKIFIPGTAAMRVFLTIFEWFNLGVLLLSLCVALPLHSIIVSRMFHHLKKVSKEKIVPIRNLDLPRGKSLHPGIKWGTVAVLSVLFVLNIGYIRPSVSRGTFWSFESMVRPFVTAHRGASLLAPENTMAAFAAAVETGADMIELDVQQLSDGTLIILHDSNFRRTTGINLNTWEATKSDLENMDAGSWFDEKFSYEPIPTLEDVLIFAHENRIRLNIELKSTGNEPNLEEAVAALIDDYNFQDLCVITSLQYSVLSRIKEINPNLTTGYILSVAYGPFYDLENADLFSVRADFITENMVASIHNHGKRIFAWTVNSEAEMERMDSLRVDSIITDTPILARSIVDAPILNDRLLDAFEQFFTGESFLQSAKRFWKVAFRP